MTFLSAAVIFMSKKNVMIMVSLSIGHHPWTMSGLMSKDVGSARWSWSNSAVVMMIAYERKINQFLIHISSPWVPRMMIGFQRELTPLMTKRVLILLLVHCQNQREKSLKDMDHLGGMVMLIDCHHHHL